jgi:hypothetical protein
MKYAELENTFLDIESLSREVADLLYQLSTLHKQKMGAELAMDSALRYATSYEYLGYVDVKAREENEIASKEGELISVLNARINYIKALLSNV